MNLTLYINSGILELYVLNSLSNEERIGVERMLKMYPALKNEVDAIEHSLEKYALANAMKPSAKLNAEIAFITENINKENNLDIENLPIINQFSNYKNWLPLAQNYNSVTLTDGVFTKLLQHNEKLTQILVVSESNIPEEVHEDEHESFLILAGQCECIFSGKTRLMGPGDFMAIPLFEPHDVVLKSKRVTAILQLIKV